MGLAEVREAGVDDAAVLGGLQLEFWQQAYAALLPASLLDRSDADQAQAWRLRLQAGGTALLATEGGAPVGFALLDPEPADGIGEIQALGVLPRWSRRGHGGRLLATAALHLRRAGAGTGRYWAPVGRRGHRGLPGRRRLVSGRQPPGARHRRRHPGRAVLLGNARPGAGLIPDHPAGAISRPGG